MKQKEWIRLTLCLLDDMWSKRVRVQEFGGKHTSHLFLHMYLPNTALTARRQIETEPVRVSVVEAQI